MKDPRSPDEKGPPSHLIFKCFPLFGHPVQKGGREGSDGGDDYIVRHNTYVQGRRATVHHSFDIHADEGTAIIAPMRCKVARAESDRLGGWNITVHAEGPTYKWTLYCAHLSAKVKGIKAGDRVIPGLPLGLVGSTGDATGPHLHMTVTEGHSFSRDPKYRVDPGAQLFRYLSPAAKPDHYRLSPAGVDALPPLLGMAGMVGYTRLIEAIMLERYARRLVYTQGRK